MDGRRRRSGAAWFDNRIVASAAAGAERSEYDSDK